MRTKRPTLDDVALASGVARVTVSRVLNGGPNVREEVREKVLRAVSDLDYRFNEQARRLAGGRSRLVTLVFASDLHAQPNSFWEAGLELGALRACTQWGFQLTTQRVVNETRRGRELVRDLIETDRCEGIILTPPHSDDSKLLEWILAHNCPAVCVAPGGPEGRAFASVGIDDAQAGYDVARHLLDLGHERFGFLGGLEGHYAAEHRLDGVRRALREHGISDIAVMRGDFTFQAGADLAPQILNLATPPTALICANDDMAIGALLAAHRLGIVVPDQLSVTGFDDTPVSGVVWPPLTTVHQPITDMGARAVELIVEQLRSPSPRSAGGFRLLPHAMVIRASAAPPR